MTEKILSSHNRERFQDLIELMKTTDKKPGTGKLYHPGEDCYCVLGLALSEFDPDVFEEYVSSPGDGELAYDRVAALLGLSDGEMTLVYRKNDSLLSHAVGPVRSWDPVREWLEDELREAD